ncbi:hypothetical protein [Nocardioides alcanivorans]|uniref:hypothetical protein n=1 Tax=Nocardioides alcanivorans TaxID=2897352 RepID=UPI001F220E07|nr:hypothetical protein [Nocardioides alcanivorans]
MRVADGSLVAGFNAGKVTGEVRDLALVRNRLWIAGAFTHVGSRAQKALATIDPATGAPTRHMALPLAGQHHGGTTQVLAIDATAAGDRLALVGNFRTVGGAARRQLAVLDIGASTAKVATFRTNFYADTCSGKNTTYLRDVAFEPGGSWFVAVTTGGVGGPGRPCDTAARFETQAGATVPTWLARTGGDTMTAVTVARGAVYVGGHFRWLNNPYGANRPAPGAVPRSGIAALDPFNGLPLPWDPGRTRGWGCSTCWPPTRACGSAPTPIGSTGS